MAALLAFSTLTFASDHDGKFVLVIDAGHGGHDVGAKGAQSYEKNINLKVLSPTEIKPTSSSPYTPTHCLQVK